jgi:hypothetical protein
MNTNLYSQQDGALTDGELSDDMLDDVNAAGLWSRFRSIGHWVNNNRTPLLVGVAVGVALATA